MKKWKVISILTSACAAILLLPAVATAAKPACIANFSKTGSFLRGREFKTWEDFSNVSKADAYTRLYAAMIKDGWKITSSDKDVGAISAAQEVSFGNGKAAPFSVLVQQKGQGVEVTETYSLSSMESVSLKVMQGKFCSYMDAVEGK